MMINPEPLYLTLKLAGLTTAILYTIGLPAAWFISQSRMRLKPLLEAVLALPLVLPPSVLGFYFLLPSGVGWRSMGEDVRSSTCVQL